MSIRKIFLFCLFIACVGSCFAENSDLIIINNSNAYIIRERIVEGNSQTELFSLFIWKNNAIYRILYQQEKHYLLPKGSKCFTPFDEVFNLDAPLYYIKRKTKKVYTSEYLSNLTYEGNEALKYPRDSQKKFYAILTSINHWNQVHNRYADKFELYQTSEGTDLHLSKNKARTTAYINNLPIAFRVKDSISIIKPLHIDIYLKDNSRANHLLNDVESYSLYNSISLVNHQKDSFSSDFYEDEKSCPLTTIGKTILKRIYRPIFPADESKLWAVLFKYPLSPFQYSALLTYRKTNSFENYQYCLECYDESLDKYYRVQRCPFSLSYDDRDENANWKYLFAYNGLLFFQVENPLPITNVDLSTEQILNNGMIDQYNLKRQQWQLICPGIGYWVSDYRANYDSSTNRFSTAVQTPPVFFQVNHAKPKRTNK